MVEEKTVPELMREFVAELMLYVRQRGKETVTHVVVEPIAKAGAKIALLMAAAAMAILGVVFLGIFMVHGFTALFGSFIWGYLASAVLILLLAGGLLFATSRVGKEEERKHGQPNGDAGGNGHRGRPAG